MFGHSPRWQCNPKEVFSRPKGVLEPNQSPVGCRAGPAFKSNHMEVLAGSSPQKPGLGADVAADL